MTTKKSETQVMPAAVRALREILEIVSKEKYKTEGNLVVTLAFRLNKTTPTIYAWKKISDNDKALNKLLLISQINKDVVAGDGPVITQIIDLASNAVRAYVN